MATYSGSYLRGIEVDIIDESHRSVPEGRYIQTDGAVAVIRVVRTHPNMLCVRMDSPEVPSRPLIRERKEDNSRTRYVIKYPHCGVDKEELLMCYKNSNYK